MTGLRNTASLPETFTTTSDNASREARASSAGDWSATGTSAEYISLMTSAQAAPVAPSSTSAKPKLRTICLIKSFSRTDEKGAL